MLAVGFCRVLASRHSNCLGFPFDPLCASHSSSGRLRVCFVWDLLELGSELHDLQFTPECCYFPNRKLCQCGILQLRCRMCTWIFLNGQSLSNCLPDASLACVRNHVQPWWPSHVWANSKGVFFSIDPSPFVPGRQLDQPPFEDSTV